MLVGCVALSLRADWLGHWGGENQKPHKKPALTKVKSLQFTLLLLTPGAAGLCHSSGAAGPIAAMAAAIPGHTQQQAQEPGSDTWSVQLGHPLPSIATTDSKATSSAVKTDGHC